MSAKAKATKREETRKERENKIEQINKQQKYNDAENMEDGLEDNVEDISKVVNCYVNEKNGSMEIERDNTNFIRKTLLKYVGPDFYSNFRGLSHNGELFWSDSYANCKLLEKKKEEEEKDNKFTEDMKRKTEGMVSKLVASRTKCEEMKDRIECLENENNYLQSKVKEQECINTMQKLNINELSSENERLKKQCNELRKTKRQGIDEQERLTAEFNDKISDLHKDKEKLEENIREKTREIDDLKDELRNESQIMLVKEEEISTLREEIMKDKPDLNENVREMKEHMRQNNEKEKEISRLTKEIKLLAEKYKKKQEKLHVCEQDKKKLSERIKKLEIQIKAMEKNIGELETDKKQISDLDQDEKHKEKKEKLHVCEEYKKNVRERIKKLEDQIIAIVQSIYQMTLK